MFEEVWKIVQGIPVGRVATYGQVAVILGTKDSRRVGQALHANKNPKISCHRVVFVDGSLALGYAFGGPGEQKKKLLAEGVKFRGDKVDLEKHRWSGYNP